MKLVVKTHIKDRKTLVAVCDKDIKGSVFEEGGSILDLSSSFYDGELMPEEEVCDLIRNADMVNLVGTNAVKLGVEEEIVDDENIKIIEGIPYAFCVVVEE